jgi:hypothetical protein
MANRSNAFDHSLLQRDPNRDAMLSKMRGKLAASAAPLAAEVRRKEVARREKWTWTVRIATALALVAINFLVLEKKDVILAKMGYEGVPSLPRPASALDADEQALYYVYALYDYGKLKQRFQVDGYFAIDQASARRALEELMPRVSPATLGEISKYTPVAFKSVSAGAGR